MKTVLIVEDYPSLQTIYGTVLAEAKFEVTHAADGEEALSQVHQKHFDLIILDMLMPRVSGMEFLRHFQAERPADTRIIVFSNVFTPEMAKEAKALGADRYYTKAAFTPKEMLTMIKEVT